MIMRNELTPFLATAIAITVLEIVVFADANGAPTDGPPVLVEVSIDQSKANEVYLNVHFTSHLTNSISLYEGSLPWRHWQSIILVAARPGHDGEVLENVFPLDNPGPSVFVMKPGSEVQGRIPLHTHFPTLVKSLTEEDIILFWSYELVCTDGRRLPRVGGWLQLKRRT
jgi:hypothetical protein